MNLLFSVGYYSGIYDANINIAITVAEELEKRGHQCLLLLYSDEAIEESRTVLNGREFCVLPINRDRDDYRKKYRKSGQSKLVYSILHPVSTLKFLLAAKNDFLDSVCIIDSKIQNGKYDYLISLVSPFNATQAVIKNTKGIRKVIYQLDPWGFHELLSRNGIKQRRRDEMELFDMCSHVFTTDILYNLYKNDVEYHRYMEKITSFHFPGLIKHNGYSEASSSLFNSEYTIVYTGTIDDKYRNPKRIFDILIQLKKSYGLDLKIYLFGRTTLSDTAKEYEKLYKDTVVVCGEVDADISKDIMNSKNIFLLNINNTLKNQSPSKLIDYISTGNPIINVVKHYDDISRSILANHEFAYSIYENEKCDYKKLYDFMKTSKNRRMDYSDLNKLYYEYTPAFTAEKMEKIMLPIDQEISDINEK